MFETAAAQGVRQFRCAGARWLSTGLDGGHSAAGAAYMCSVDGEWCPDAPGEALERRREAAGFGLPGPVLATAVDLGHCRGARCGPVTAYATAGLSNPAPLPSEPTGTPDPAGETLPDRPPTAGTVNLLVGTTRSLAPGALANLVAVATEAKTATLLDRTGVPGTTTDAVIAACRPEGEPARFSGSATRVGAATRACVREALGAALESRYGPDLAAATPDGVGEAEYGASTDVRAAVIDPEGGR